MSTGAEDEKKLIEAIAAGDPQKVKSVLTELAVPGTSIPAGVARAVARTGSWASALALTEAEEAAGLQPRAHESD